MTACPPSWYARIRRSFSVTMRALLEAGDHPLHRRVEVGLGDVVPALAAGEDRGFVADVREVGAGQTGGLSCDDVEVDVLSERLPAGVHAEDLLAACEVG